MGKMSRLGNELYQGRRSFDFVGKRGLWYGITFVLVGLAITSVVVNGLKLGVEFTGGTEFKVTVGAGKATQAEADRLRELVGGSDIPDVGNPSAITSGDAAITIQTEDLSVEGVDDVRALILENTPGLSDDDISHSDVGPSWGRDVAQRAAVGVAVFLVLVCLFIGTYFREWKMSLAALVALFHDIALTVGVYSLSGFQVTPAAVTGLLAILGFSLYDTVVVFDKVRENTTTLRKSGQSYGDAANLAVNQTLVRSINTSIVALIPIGAILYVSTIQLGASSLQDLALAQFVGMAAGVYSSVMLAPRVLVHLKSGESAVQELERRARAKQKVVAADRYASVPTTASDRPVARDRAAEVAADDDDSFRVDVEVGRDEDGYAAYQPPSAGRGRNLPTEKRPVSDSSASGRKQPQRSSRSDRKKS